MWTLSFGSTWIYYTCNAVKYLGMFSFIFTLSDLDK